MSGNVSVLQTVIEKRSQACKIFYPNRTACGLMTAVVESGRQIGICRGETDKESFLVCRRKYDVSVWRKTSGLV